MNPILLSTVLLFSFLYVINCTPKDQQNRHYYEYYAEAVNHYYREPRSPDKAIAVLREACRKSSDRRDVSCYNLGVILENEKQFSTALEAYRRAYQLRGHPLYREAIQSLAPDPGAYSTAYFRAFRGMTRACEQENPAEALRIFKTLLAARPASGPTEESPDESRNPESAAPNEGLHREIFAQPIFTDCLGDRSEFQELLAALPERSDDLTSVSVHHQALNSPYHTLWDMESHLLRLTRSRDSDHPVTRHWQGVLAARGSGGRAAARLSDFLGELDRVEAGAGPDDPNDTARRVLAMKRAAAVLIDRDPFFGGIRGNGRVRKLIAPYLKP